MQEGGNLIARRRNNPQFIAVRKIYQEQSISQEQPANPARLLDSECAGLTRGELIVSWSLAPAGNLLPRSLFLFFAQAAVGFANPIL